MWKLTGRHVRVGVVLVGVFCGGVGATRACDLWERHQAAHAAQATTVPAMVRAINALLAETPAAVAALQQPIVAPPTEAETPVDDEEEARADAGNLDDAP
jgi:hypothetical protein